jgi:MFS family permease
VAPTRRPFGFILANGFFLLLTFWFNYDSKATSLNDPFLVWGWRIPFLLSILMVLVGLYVRLKLRETPVFAHAVERGEKLKFPLVKLFRHDYKELILGTFIMLATYGLFYLMTTWILSYAIGSVRLGFLGIGYRDFLILQLISVLWFAAMIPSLGTPRRSLWPPRLPAGGDRGDHSLWFFLRVVPGPRGHADGRGGQSMAHADLPEYRHGADGADLRPHVRLAARTVSDQSPL